MFRTVFDAASLGYFNWWLPAFGLIFVALGAALVFKPELLAFLPDRLPPRVQRVASWSFFTFALLGTVITFLGTFLEYRTVMSAVSTGRYSVVAGAVANFSPMPNTGHEQESFTVEGRRFAYSDADVTLGFHTTASQGGPIREGLYVRITYLGNRILRLEVPQ